MTYFKSLSGRQRLFFLVFLTAIIALLIVYFAKGVTGTIVISLIIAVLLFITRNIWQPENYGRTRVRIYSLYIALIVALTFTGWKYLLEEFIVSFIQNKFPDFFKDYPIQDVSPAIVFTFIFLVIVVVNYLGRDKSAMKADLPSLDKEFPEWEYEKERDVFTKILRNQIEKINLETNWSAQFYTDLDAEIEASYQTGSRKKVKNLIKAIRKDRTSKAFLILGDPGAGKSVSLRKLATELIDEEVNLTNKIPLYINLKEWKVDKEWNEQNPPTTKELFNFVFNNLKGIDIFADEFLDKYFGTMFKNGYFFLILDSFDEIPAVLDKDEKSWLVDKLSEVIYDFIDGAHLCRGILSSRHFRKPTSKFRASTTCFISPFSEEKVKNTFFSNIKDKTLAKELFQRNELLQSARNPFIASLISTYVKSNNKIPPNQYAIYQDYIESRLKNCKEKLNHLNLNIKDVFDSAIEIAELMFKSDIYGLEIPKKNLIKTLNNEKIENVLIILKYARIGRLGGENQQNFSFAHRRFTEFFAVQQLLNNPNNLPLESIPTDSRWRDTLVLFTEVASFAQAKTIANFCWKEMTPLKDNKYTLISPEYYKGIHTLRFLTEAFKIRKECLIDFQEDLGNLIENKLDSDNLLEIKLAVEGTGLLNVNVMQRILIKALKIRNSWINQNALAACKYITFPNEKILKKIYIHFLDDSDVFLKNATSQFSLNENFKILNRWFKYRRIEVFSLLIISIIASLIFEFDNFVEFSLIEFIPLIFKCLFESFIIFGLLCGLTAQTLSPTWFYIHGLKLNMNFDFRFNLKNAIKISYYKILNDLRSLPKSIKTIFSKVFFITIKNEIIENSPRIISQMLIFGQIFISFFILLIIQFYFAKSLNVISEFSFENIRKVIGLGTTIFILFLNIIISIMFFSYANFFYIKKQFSKKLIKQEYLNSIERRVVEENLVLLKYPIYQSRYINKLIKGNIMLTGLWSEQPSIYLNSNNKWLEKLWVTYTRTFVFQDPLTGLAILESKSLGFS